jgi:DNA mismatch repair protein MutL
VLFRSVPAVWGTENLKIRLKNLLERTLGAPGLTSRALMEDEAVFEKLASEACHSSVRAGDRVDEARARRIASDLFACKHPWNCPHGRPTVARVPKARFEEWFLRSL